MIPKQAKSELIWAKNRMDGADNSEDKHYYSGYIKALERNFFDDKISDTEDAAMRGYLNDPDKRLAAYGQGYAAAIKISEKIKGKKSLLGNAVIQSFRISEELKKKLDAEGIKKNKSITAIIRELIAEHYRQAEAVVPPQPAAIDTNLFGDDPAPADNDYPGPDEESTGLCETSSQPIEPGSR